MPLGNYLAASRCLARCLTLTCIRMKTCTVIGSTVSNDNIQTQRKHYHEVRQSWIPKEAIVDYENGNIFLILIIIQ